MCGFIVCGFFGGGGGGVGGGAGRRGVRREVIKFV